jgi:ribosomal protein S18
MARSANNSKLLQKPKRRAVQEAQLRRMKKRVCYFCQERVDHVDWKDVALLRRYVSDRAKIRSRRVNGNCPRHQRQVAAAIKVAREMALIGYIGR